MKIASALICIQVPRSENTEASQIRRKSLVLSTLSDSKRIDEL